MEAVEALIGGGIGAAIVAAIGMLGNRRFRRVAAAVIRELEPNGGESIRDRVEAINSSVADLARDHETTNSELAAIQDRLRSGNGRMERIEKDLRTIQGALIDRGLSH